MPPIQVIALVQFRPALVLAGDARVEVPDVAAGEAPINRPAVDIHRRIVGDAARPAHDQREVNVFQDVAVAVEQGSGVGQQGGGQLGQGHARPQKTRVVSLGLGEGLEIALNRHCFDHRPGNSLRRGLPVKKFMEQHLLRGA